MGAGGADVRCVADDRVCTGMPVGAAFAYLVEDHVGGVLDISCGFSEPGAGALNHLTPLDLMSADCLESRYVISFSTGSRLTNVWVDAGQIVRLDDYSRHSLDL